MTEPPRWVFDGPAQLRSWAKRLGRLLRAGDFVALVGELGAGKTTLVQGVAEGWGYAGANSPTFALANEYRTPRGLLYHLDVYRLSPGELARFPLEEYGENGVCLVEWADRVRDRWPEKALEISLDILSPGRRAARLRWRDPSWRRRLAALGRGKR